MSRFSSFFTKRLFIISLVFDIPISLLFTYQHTFLRHIPFWSKQAFMIGASFLVFDYIIILLVFSVLFWISTMQKK